MLPEWMRPGSPSELELSLGRTRGLLNNLSGNYNINVQIPPLGDGNRVYAPVSNNSVSNVSNIYNTYAVDNTFNVSSVGGKRRSNNDAVRQAHALYMLNRGVGG